MKIFQDTNELINYRKQLNGNIGFVATMGALHQGHISLIKESIKNNDKTIVSIFVNPTQFLPGEDFTSYPNRYQADLKICELAGVDALFVPHVSDIYFDVEPSISAPMKESYILEGYKRPTHFDGVLRIILKLLNITHPTHAYFGKKDAQQLFLINNMVKTLFIDTIIVPCEIIRNENGLALSSRNAYLSDEEKQKALSISRSLQVATNAIIQKELSTTAIKEKMIEVLSQIEVEYIEITNRAFQKIETIEIKNSIILVAAKVGATRLIDNMWI